MVGERLEILTENPEKTYRSGQEVRGTCQLEIKFPLKIKELVMTFEGKAHCEWSEEGNGGQNQNRQWHVANEQYFDLQQVVYGKEQTGQESVELPIGRYSYPFTFTVPTNQTLPSSYEGFYGYVRYFLTATLVKPWSFNNRTFLVINIESPLDLNTMSTDKLMNPSEGKGQKTICCLCCESGPITSYVTTERKGYVPGDTVQFNAEVVNNSRRSLQKVKGQLVMVVTFIANAYRKTITNKLQKVQCGSLKAGDSYLFRNERLAIPPVPPSYLRGCNIIDIRYYVQIVSIPAGPAINLRVNAEIVVGSIPLAEVASHHGVTIPSPPDVQGSSFAPSGIYEETSLCEIPQASYAESVFGVSNFGANKKENNKDSVGFVPSYTYYKWNQQNTADMFVAKM